MNVRTRLPVSRSQSLTRPSKPDDTRSELEGTNATAEAMAPRRGATARMCPSSGRLQGVDGAFARGGGSATTAVGIGATAATRVSTGATLESTTAGSTPATGGFFPLERKKNPTARASAAAASATRATTASVLLPVSPSGAARIDAGSSAIARASPRSSGDFERSLRMRFSSRSGMSATISRDGCGASTRTRFRTS